MKLGTLEKREDGSYTVPNWDGAVDPTPSKCWIVLTPTKEYLYNLMSESTETFVEEMFRKDKPKEKEFKIGQLGYGGPFRIRTLGADRFIPNSRLWGSDGYISTS